VHTLQSLEIHTVSTEKGNFYCNSYRPSCWQSCPRFC